MYMRFCLVLQICVGREMLITSEQQPRAPHFPGHGRGSGPVGQIGGSVGCPPSLSKDTVQTQPVKNKERWLGLS